MTLDEMQAELKRLNTENADLRLQLRRMRERPDDITPSPMAAPQTTAVTRKSRDHA